MRYNENRYNKLFKKSLGILDCTGPQVTSMSAARNHLTVPPHLSPSTRVSDIRNTNSMTCHDRSISKIIFLFFCLLKLSAIKTTDSNIRIQIWSEMIQKQLEFFLCSDSNMMCSNMMCSNMIGSNMMCSNMIGSNIVQLGPFWKFWL